MISENKLFKMRSISILQKWIKRNLFCLFFAFIPILIHSQVLNKSYLNLNEEPEANLAGNSVTDIKFYMGSLWVGTGGGLSRTEDNGESWHNYRAADGIGKGGISALAFYGETIWIATAFDTLVQEGNLSAGGGLSYSNDNGSTWHHIPQPGATNIQNVTYDIAILDSVVWTTSYGGGLKRSDDWGQTWQDAPPDTFFFDPLLHLNHRAFSATVADSVLWVGTAGGINRSMDNGDTWVNFNHQNQDYPISGNFVVAIAHQKWNNRDIIWSATIEAEDPNEYRAVSFTENNGKTWETTLEGEFAHNFAFDDSVVYVATDNGLFKSIDFGKTWDSVSEIQDRETGERIFTHEFFSVGVSPGPFLWAGTSDGLARSDDGGTSWKVFHTFDPLTNDNNVSETYAYPNPFSPMRHNQLNNEGHVRFHYRANQSGPVSIKIYDFDMTLVRELEGRAAGEGEYDAVWNGRNDFNELVANGVYFYRVDLPGGKSVWGKVIVMN